MDCFCVYQFFLCLFFSHYVSLYVLDVFSFVPSALLWIAECHRHEYVVTDHQTKNVASKLLHENTVGMWISLQYVLPAAAAIAVAVSLYEG